MCGGSRAGSDLWGFIGGAYGVENSGSAAISSVCKSRCMPSVAPNRARLRAVGVAFARCAGRSLRLAARVSNLRLFRGRRPIASQLLTRAIVSTRRHLRACTARHPFVRTGALTAARVVQMRRARAPKPRQATQGATRTLPRCRATRPLFRSRRMCH